MQQRFSLILMIGAVTMTYRAALAEEKADLSTPKGTVLAFFKAMETGDVSAAKNLAIGSERQLEVLDTLVPLVQGFRQLENAAVKKWGEDGRKLLPQQSAVKFDFDEQLRAATQEIVADTATITSRVHSDTKKDPIKLKKVEGEWKMDMSSLPIEDASNPGSIQLLKTMASVARTTADEIKQGKHKSVAEAKQAMEQKITAALGEGSTEKSKEAKP